MHEVEFGCPGEVANREYAAKSLLEAGNVIDFLVRTQELFVALALDLDQVRHIDDFVNVAEDLADTTLRRALRVCAPGFLRSFRHGSHKG